MFSPQTLLDADLRPPAGIPDVDQMVPQELAAHKIRVVLSATDPKILDHGIKGCYTGWTAIIAVLKLQFAKMIALGAAIGDFLIKFVEKPGSAFLAHTLRYHPSCWEVGHKVA